MESIRLEFKGTTPLLMKNNQGVNPLHPINAKKKAITKKKNRTEEDYRLLYDLDWELGLYWEEGIGAVIPSNVVEACLRDAAKRTRRGKQVVEGIIVRQFYIPLDFPDKKLSLEELRDSRKYEDIRVAGIQRSSIMVCRPRFNMWSIEFDLEYDPSIFDRNDVIEIAKTAGNYTGICDYRPRYGRFEVIVKD